MIKLKAWMSAFLVTAGFGGMLFTVAAPLPVSAACANPTFFGIPTWYRGLVREENGQCNLRPPGDFATGNRNNGLQNFIWRIVLNVIDIMLSLVGLIALGFLIFGGFKFMLAQGSPEGAAGARKTITNAIIGIVIAVAAIAIVRLVGSAF